MRQSKITNKKLLRAAMLFGFVLALASAARAQSADVGKTLDRFLDRVTVAADAASVVVEADGLKREAEQKSKAGQRDEARALLRQAGDRLVAEQPLATWNLALPNEYGFYSNVNPNVDHPRWSQAKERRIGEYELRDTLLFNGYADQVAQLYAGMDLTTYF